MSRRRDEDATATLELVVLAPLVLLVMSLMFAFGRVSQTESLVDQASRDGARAATAQNSRAQAPVVASQVVTETMSTAPTSCRSTVDPRTSFSSAQAFELPDLSDPTRIESVQVRVSCDLNLSDLAFIPVQSWRIPVTRTFVSPLDRYRGYQP